MSSAATTASKHDDDNDKKDDGVIVMETLAERRGDDDDNKDDPVTGGAGGRGSGATASSRWTRTVYRRVHEPYLRHVLHPLTQGAGRNPKRTLFAVAIVTMFTLVMGLVTNFHVEVDGDLLWTPKDVRTVRHRQWVTSPERNGGYPPLPRIFYVFLHRPDGANVLLPADVNRLFQAMDAVRNLSRYDAVCNAGSDDVNPVSTQQQVTTTTTCDIQGTVRFWNYTQTAFARDVTTADDLWNAVSQPAFPDGVTVSPEEIWGRPVRNDTTGRWESAQGLMLLIYFPRTDAALEFESEAVDTLLALGEAWNRNDDDTEDNLRLRVLAERSFDDEIDRAIVEDIPLVPVVFIVMGVFTATIFARCRDTVRSRSLLGWTAVVSILFSIMTAYGLMFMTGVSFTSMTQILPFVIFGIGLDDTFVIMGAYSRTSGETLDRIYYAMEEVGTSITLTTLTSALAFGLGCLSSVPAVYWLCLYAVPTIVLVYLYQITFFVAAIVLDEKRIADNRRDCCTCLTVKQKSDEADDDGNGNNGAAEEENTDERATTGNDDQRPAMDDKAPLNVVEKFIEWYAEFLMRPLVKAVVIVSFLALVGLCAWSASQLTQFFDVVDVMPKDSYASAYIRANEEHSDVFSSDPMAYFRFVNQSLPSVQAQMRAYVQDLVNIDAVPGYPPFFWLDDFEMFVEGNNATVGALSFNQQVDAFLDLPEYGLLYGDHIVRDPESGDILTSRVRVSLGNVDIGNVQNELAAFEDQSAVTAAQEINRGKDDYPFFLYDEIFQIWEFYDACVDELILTTILGVVTVTGVALFFVPHWTAALFVLPLICMLYVDLLGIMQWGGVHVDPVSYVASVMSIGLLVDFILHVLLRYYECPGNRREKTIAMLKSMGVSILTGGISTFLGTMPLAFSTSTIFQTIFIAFLGLSTLGVGHGLILLPVVLSIVGPEDQVVRSAAKATDDTKEENEGANMLENEETVDA